jgi:hypothetical protein
MSFRPSTSESGLRFQPESFKTRLLQLADETLDSLQAIWTEAGYEDVECQGLLGDFLKKIKDTCSSELAAEQQILDHAKQTVTAKIDEFTKLCQQLGRQPCGHQSYGDNCADRLAELERLIAEISIEVSQRQKLLDVEFDAIDELVRLLGEPAPSHDLFKGPEGDCDNEPVTVTIAFMLIVVMITR